MNEARESNIEAARNPSCSSPENSEATSSRGIQPERSGLSAELSGKLLNLSLEREALARCRNDQERAERCSQLRALVESLSRCASAAGVQAVVRQATALDAFLRELCAKPGSLTGSGLRTLSLALELLVELVRHPLPAQQQLEPPVAVLVDDQHVSRTAACLALSQAGLRPYAFSSAAEALNYLGRNPADLLVLDMQRSNLEIYNKIRELPLHEETPAVFISSQPDVQYSNAGGATDGTQILTKPYNMITYLELALKGLTRVLKHQTTAGTATSQATEPKPSQEQKTSPEQAAPKTENVEKAVPVAKEPEKPVGPIPPQTQPEPSKPAEALPVGSDQSALKLLPLPAESAKVVAEKEAEKDELVLVLDEPKPPVEQGKVEEEPKLLTEQENLALKEKVAQMQQLEEELATLKQTCEGLKQELKAEREAVAEATRAKEENEKGLREAQAANPADGTDGERRLRENAAAYARLSGELEQERAERRRAEQRAAALAPQLQGLHEQLIQHLDTEAANQKRVTELEKQLRQRDDALNHVNAELNKEKEERQLAEEQLRTSGNLCVQLRNCLSSFEEAKKGYKRTNDELQSRLQSAQNALKEGESRLRKETGERQRLEEALAEAQRQLQEQTEHHGVELSTLQTALESEQAERRRLEVDAIQSRYASLDSARANLAMVNKFRRQIQEPAELLMQSTCRLLDTALEPESQKLVQSMLENVILLRGQLQEVSSTNAAPGTQPGEAAPSSPNPVVEPEQLSIQTAGTEELAA